MRRDVHVPNESDGFVFTSSVLRARGIAPGDPGWAAAVAACDLLALGVESEDPANVRVVLGEPLAPSEQDEWVGVVRSALRVPDGRLALCGGIAYVFETAAWAEECAAVLQVPPGDYRATLYCYACAPNGRLCIERSGSNEPLGAWFRRTRPGQAMPTWLHNLCVNDPSLDPGYAAKWKRAGEKSGGPVVDFLLHLEAADGPMSALSAARVTAEGFLEAGECRKPDRFPLGIPAIGLAGTQAEDSEAPPPTKKVATSAASADSGELIAIAGGPVSVPVSKLARIGQIAWMCHPYTHPGLRVTFAAEPPRLEDVEDAMFAAAGRELQISFVNNSQPADALAPLTAVAEQLAAIPDGAVLEFHSAQPRSKSALGAHHYRGTVRGGIWQIEASLPQVDAACLSEALALAEALESGRRLSARDEDEADRIEKYVSKVLADYFGANALQRTGAELALRRRDPTLFAHVVARVFWSRYASTWPLQNDDANR